jgi:hypothetical protein
MTRENVRAKLSGSLLPYSRIEALASLEKRARLAKH